MDEMKYSVKELAEICGKMPDTIKWFVRIAIGLDGSIFDSSDALDRAIVKLALEEYGNHDLIVAIGNWNWDSHPPHTDDAILVLVEELLEEYRE